MDAWAPYGFMCAIWIHVHYMDPCQSQEQMTNTRVNQTNNYNVYIYVYILYDLHGLFIIVSMCTMWIHVHRMDPWAPSGKM